MKPHKYCINCKTSMNANKHVWVAINIWWKITFRDRTTYWATTRKKKKKEKKGSDMYQNRRYNVCVYMCVCVWKREREREREMRNRTQRLQLIKIGQTVYTLLFAENDKRSTKLVYVHCLIFILCWPRNFTFLGSRGWGRGWGGR